MLTRVLALAATKPLNLKMMRASKLRYRRAGSLGFYWRWETSLLWGPERCSPSALMAKGVTLSVLGH